MKWYAHEWLNKFSKIPKFCMHVHMKKKNIWKACLHRAVVEILLLLENLQLAPCKWINCECIHLFIYCIKELSPFKPSLFSYFVSLTWMHSSGCNNNCLPRILPGAIQSSNINFSQWPFCSAFTVQEVNDCLKEI